MRVAAITITSLFLAEMFLPGLARAEGACPNGNLEDQSLIYVSKSNILSFRGDQSTDQIPLNQKVRFLYVLAKSGNAPDSGAILVKRVYDIPEEWPDNRDVVSMRRNRERERSKFPADAYQNYHRVMTLYTPEIRRGFHVTYNGRSRTDDSARKRGAFLYSEEVINSKRKLAKSLIINWTGLGQQNLMCLDFNLNEGEGDYKKIELSIFEISPRNNESGPRRTVYLTIVPKN